MCVCLMCGGAKHLKQEKKWIRCQCLEQEILAKRTRFANDIKIKVKSTSLVEKTNKILRLEAPNFDVFKAHLAHVMEKNCKLNVVGRSITNLLQDFLSEEQEVKTYLQADLLVVTMDGVLSNKFIPSLLAGLVEDKRNTNKGMWLIMRNWSVDQFISRVDPQGSNNSGFLIPILESLPKLAIKG